MGAVVWQTLVRVMLLRDSASDAIATAAASFFAQLAILIAFDTLTLVIEERRTHGFRLLHIFHQHFRNPWSFGLVLWVILAGGPYFAPIVYQVMRSQFVPVVVTQFLSTNSLPVFRGFSAL